MEASPRAEALNINKLSKTRCCASERGGGRRARSNGCHVTVSNVSKCPTETFAQTGPLPQNPAHRLLHNHSAGHTHTRTHTQGQGGVSPSDARHPVPPCGAAAISLFIWTNIMMGGLRRKDHGEGREAPGRAVAQSVPLESRRPGK